MATLVYQVYFDLFCWKRPTSERNKPDEPDEPDQPVSPVPLYYLAGKVVLVSISDRFYCTELIRRPLGVGGAIGADGGGDPAGVKVARLLAPDSLLVKS